LNIAVIITKCIIPFVFIKSGNSHFFCLGWTPGNRFV